jgi:hypothetical protein
MKKPFQHQHITTAQPSQQSALPTPPTLRDLTDADLAHVQGGAIGIHREPTTHPAKVSVPD